MFLFVTLKIGEDEPILTIIFHWGLKPPTRWPTPLGFVFLLMILLRLSGIRHHFVAEDVSDKGVYKNP